MDINKRLQFFTKIFQRSTDLQTYVAKASGHVHEKPIGDADTTHKQRMDTPVYTTDRYATDINYAVSQFPDKSTAIVNNDVTARAKKVSQGHFTGASHYLVEEVMIENAAARGYTLMVTGWTGKGTLTKTVDGVVNEGPYAAGTQVVATFTPAAGYSFTSWGDGNTDNPRTFTMNSNIVTNIVTAESQLAFLVTISQEDMSYSSSVPIVRYTDGDVEEGTYEHGCCYCFKAPNSLGWNTVYLSSLSVETDSWIYSLSDGSYTQVGHETEIPGTGVTQLTTKFTATSARTVSALLSIDGNDVPVYVGVLEMSSNYSYDAGTLSSSEVTAYQFGEDNDVCPVVGGAVYNSSGVLIEGASVLEINNVLTWFE